jgi:hypothetical protein
LQFVPTASLVDIDGDYTETLARIDSNPNGVGVFGLAFYENNTDKLKVATMSDVAPSTRDHLLLVSIRFPARCSSTSRKHTSALSRA